MTYSAVSELPSEVRRAFDDDDARIWLEVYNQSVAETSDVFKAREDAWMNCTHLDSSRYVKSNVSTELKDADGDIAPVDEYVAVGQRFVNGGGPVTRKHSNKVVGCTWKIEKGIDSITGKPCVIAYTNFFRGEPTYESSWDDFLTHKLGWSIASVTRSEYACKENVCSNYIHPAQWFELSLVNSPRNPVTYDIDYHESSKGEDPAMLEVHVDECPIRKKYDGFKEQLKSVNVEAHLVEGGVMLLRGEVKDDADKIIAETYPGFRVVKGETDGERYALVFPEEGESDSEKGNCPAGQHEHPGVVGCHDVFRKHDADVKNQPSDVLDLTNEDIDVNAIKETPTDKLREIVVAVAQSIAHLSEEAINDFLSHTAGKEFVLAYLELKRRQVQGVDKMTEDTEKGCETKGNTEEAETAEILSAENGTTDSVKGIEDPGAVLSGMAGILAQISATLEANSTKLARLEAKFIEFSSKQGNNGGGLAQAIMEGVGGMGADAVNEAKSAESAPQAPGEEAKEEPPAEEEKNDVTATSEDKKPPFAESKESKPEEKKDDGSKEEKKKGEVETEKCGTVEMKADEAPTQTVTAEPTPVAEPKEEVKAEAPAEEPKAEPPVAEPAKAEPQAEPPKAEPAPAPEEPVVEPKAETAEVKQFNPVQKGASELTGAVLKRYNELQQKGIEVNFGNAQTTSIGNGAMGVTLTDPNLQAVSPSNQVPVFTGGTSEYGGSHFDKILAGFGKSTNEFKQIVFGR